MTIYTLLNRKQNGQGIALSCTELKELMDFNRNLKYEILRNHFKRKEITWYEDTDNNIIVIKANKIKSLRKSIQFGNKGHNRNI